MARDEFDRLLKEGIIRRSDSSWSSPLHMVPKPDGSWRPCGDYRALNNITIPDRYPVPHIEDFTLTLAGKKYFSRLDLKSAFHQLRMHPDDICKTAVTTPFGLFEFTRMPFGLKNAAQTFQRFIDEVTRDLDFAYAYIDDLFVGSESKEEHFIHLESLFKRLKEFGLKINQKKSEFGLKEITFLGYTIDKNGVRPPEAKITTIKDIIPPSTVKGIQRFIGMINYYRRCIPATSKLIIPLLQMIEGKSRNDRLSWTEEKLLAFEAIKDALSKAITIFHPVQNAPLRLVTDASDTAVGATLEQIVKGRIQPIGLFSKKLNTKYKSAYDRELEAIYLAIKHFSHQLEGCHFKILTDHKPITFAFNKRPESASPQQKRMLNYISQFSTDIEFISGSENTVADTLSRLEEITTITCNHELLVKISEAQLSDEEIKNFPSDSNLANSLKELPVPGFNKKMICDTTTSRPRSFVPVSLRREVFLNIHNLAHPGIRITKRLVKERFVWPNIDRDIAVWARTCVQCQRSKIQRHNRPPIGSFNEPDSRFTHIHMDLVGPLPQSQGHTYLLTIIDRFSKWLEVIPLKDSSAETIAHQFLFNWIARFGCPKILTTDRGANLIAAAFPHIHRLLGIKHLKTTPYHPSANGMIERTHRFLKGAIKAHENKNWFSRLPMILLGSRVAIKEDIAYSPAQLTLGTQLRLPTDFFESSDLPNVTHGFATQLHEQMEQLQPPKASRHGQRQTFIHKDLTKCTHIFIRSNNSGTLNQPYTGPYKVVSKHEQYFTILKDRKEQRINLEHIKPAFLLNEEP